MVLLNLLHIIKSLVCSPLVFSPIQTTVSHVHIRDQPLRMLACVSNEYVLLFFDISCPRLF